MRYNVHLFALDAGTFAARLRDESEQLLESMREHWTSRSDVSPRDLEFGLRLARDFCRGEEASTASPDQIWAIYWLLDSAAERVPLPPLEGVNRYGFVDDVGVPAVMGLHAPPFPVPSPEGAASIGYIPSDGLRAAMALLDGLRPGDGSVQEARRAFVEILESLDEDALDAVILITE